MRSTVKKGKVDADKLYTSLAWLNWQKHHNVIWENNNYNKDGTI